MTSPLDAFREAYGHDWYLFVNSPLWQAAKAVLREAGPASGITNATPAEMAAFGVVFASFQQGFSDCIKTIEEVLPARAEGDLSPENEEANYGAEAEPSPKSRKRKTTR